jgi:hypothetical protein
VLQIKGILAKILLVSFITAIANEMRFRIDMDTNSSIMVKMINAMKAPNTHLISFASKIFEVVIGM